MPDDNIKKPELQVQIVSRPPMFAIDGHSINIKKEGVVDILFFQSVGKNDKVISVNGVSSLRLTLPQFKEFVKVASGLIDKHEKEAK